MLMPLIRSQCTWTLKWRRWFLKWKSTEMPSLGTVEGSADEIKLEISQLFIYTAIIHISTIPFDYLFFSILEVLLEVCIYKSCLYDFDMHQPFETGRLKSRKHFDFNAFLLRLATLAYLVKKEMPG